MRCSLKEFCLESFFNMGASTNRSNLACSPFAVLLLIITGSLGQDSCSVTYRPRKFCSLKGSSVTMYCTYTVPEGHTVTKALWFKGQNPGVVPKDLMLDPEYRGRVEYLGDSERLCTLRITDLKDTDSDMYSFLFTTDITPVNCIGNPGVALTVTSLGVKLTPDPVEEGGWALLQCGSCFLSENPIYTWYRDRRPLTRNNKTSLDVNLLDLEPVGGEDEGSYTCAVSGRKDSPGSAATLKVEYFPKNTSVSVSPSGEIVEGGSVTLTCSSEGDPPVNGYTWYKKNAKSAKASGQSYSIADVSSEDSGEYYCEARNAIGAKNSKVVPINVSHGPKKTSVSVSPSGEIVEGSSVTLTCSSDANPPADEYTWYKKSDNPEHLSPIGSGQSYIITNVTSKDSGQYLCKVENRYGGLDSEPIPVSVQGKSVFPWVPVVVAGAVLAAGALLVLFCCTLKRRNTEDTNIGADSQLVPCGKLPHMAHPDDTYTSLNRKSTSPDYDTLENVRDYPSDTCHQGDAEYENILGVSQEKSLENSDFSKDIWLQLT